MPLNLTFDDTASVLSFSKEWNVQQPSDTVNNAHFLQGTYHSVVSAGPSLSVTFNGSAIFIYGSKGPTYGSFKVQRDDRLTFNTSHSDTVAFQQLLFADSFALGAHTVVLTTTPNGAGAAGWVDVDFVTLTVDGSSQDPNANSGAVSTVPFGESSSTASGSPSSSGILSQSTTIPTHTPNGPPSNLPTILSIVFGTIVGLFILFVCALFIVRRVRHNRREREREFRRGPLPETTRDGTTTAFARMFAFGGSSHPSRTASPVYSAAGTYANSVSGLSGRGAGTQSALSYGSRGTAPGIGEVMNAGSMLDRGGPQQQQQQQTWRSNGVSPMPMRSLPEDVGQYYDDHRHSVDFLSVRS